MAASWLNINSELSQTTVSQRREWNNVEASVGCADHAISLPGVNQVMYLEVR
jgi:hypothetical protein